MNLFPLLLNFQENTTTAFDDLGKLLLGGTVAAILLAIGFTVVRMRMREKRPQTSNFISISSPENETPAK
ncbi:MAG TPA: hypothetical protein VL907_05180 [Pyrinomonadaceae bacterium]|jgi:hypothetical protein|nr:hypothetical protein [Pyrinomonadaceae bacterium]